MRAEAGYLALERALIENAEGNENRSEALAGAGGDIRLNASVLRADW